MQLTMHNSCKAVYCLNYGHAAPCQKMCRLPVHILQHLEQSHAVSDPAPNGFAGELHCFIVIKADTFLDAQWQLVAIKADRFLDAQWQLVANMEASAREARAKAAEGSKLKDRTAPSKDVWGADVSEDVELDKVRGSCFWCTARQPADAGSQPEAVSPGQPATCVARGRLGTITELRSWVCLCRCLCMDALVSMRLCRCACVDAHVSLQSQEKLAAAVKAAERFNAEDVEVDERKRKYNAASGGGLANGDAEPTPEEMEAYRLKRARADDPLAAIGSSGSKGYDLV